MKLRKPTTFPAGSTMIVATCCCIFLLLSAGTTGQVAAQAGSIAASVERSLARKLAQRGEVAVLTAAERTALAKIWRDLDQKTLVAIERRYGSQISAQRLSQAGRTPATFMDRATFDKHLRESAPDMSEAKRKQVLGYYFDGQVNVNGNQVQVPLTAAHERLHQLAHPRFRDTFGRDMDEGVTEHFARGIYGDLGLADMPQVYPQEQRVVNMLGARIGEERLASAYFKGDMTSLRNRLDADLGKGTSERLAQVMRAHDMNGAEALLR
jgi:hypothetical protein